MARLVMIMRTVFCLSIAAVALLSAGCQRQAPERPPLAGAAIGGFFALLDEVGQPIDDSAFTGHYRVVYFGYTFCPDVCPTTLQTLMQGYHLFARSAPERAAKLVPIFISIDPDRDTPAVMKQYVAAFGPELRGLTGTSAAIAAAARAYGVYYRKQPAAKGASGYLVDHSSQVILFDADGKPIVLVPTDQGAQAVADALGRWVR